MQRIFEAFYAGLLFFALPFLAFRLAFTGTDRYFRLKLIPYPSEGFANGAGLAACLWMLGISFFIHGFLFKKRRNR